jgi:hypothetical protein
MTRLRTTLSSGCCADYCMIEENVVASVKDSSRVNFGDPSNVCCCWYVHYQGSVKDGR